MGPETPMTANIRARLEIAEALLRGELSGEEARARRTEVLKRSRRGRLLLRIERIERAVERLDRGNNGVIDAFYR